MSKKNQKNQKKFEAVDRKNSMPVVADNDLAQAAGGKNGQQTEASTLRTPCSFECGTLT